MIKKIITSLLLFSILFILSCSRNNNLSLQSPDKSIRVNFQLSNSTPTYQVIIDEDTVIGSSQLGFKFKNIPPMIKGFKIMGVVHSSFNEKWEPVWGQFSEIKDNHNEMLVKLIQNDSLRRKMNIRFRAFNDGVAFRYEFLEQENMDIVLISSEETYFNFNGDYTAWWIPGDYDSYEYLYNKTKLSEIDSANTPVTIQEKREHYISIHEAALTNYSGMTLQKIDSNEVIFKSKLVPYPDGIKVKTKTPFVTPWRTIQLGRKPGDLVESTMILNLNEPNKLNDVSFIKPMKYVGIWWGMHIGKWTWHKGAKHGATTENAIKYIDFAAQNGFGGVLFEGWNRGWDNWGGRDAFNFIEPYDDFDINRISEYAKEKGVQIIGHHETGGDVPNYERQIDSAFAYYKKLGITSVKTGYAGGIYPRGYHHHGQWMVNHYRKVVELAAEYGIAIDVHEPIKPTGISRTFPNMMTREGARGMEYNAWSEGNPPSHTCILPFTRLLGGPLDYTPGIFDLLFNDYRKENRVHSTLAKQLALYVVIYSPLQMAADLIENYEDVPAFKFIKEVPTNWDDTKVLNAEIGEYVTIARRNGIEWFIGSITNEEPRKIKINLDFLEEDKKYIAEIYSDGKDANYQTNPYSLTIKEQKVKATDSIELQLASGGGAAIKISYIK